MWKLNKALYGHRKAPKLWHQHVVSLLQNLNYHPLLTDPSCFRNDESNINIFIHGDDGLLFCPRVEVLRLVELLSVQVMMRIVGRMEKLGDKIFFLGRVIERTARGNSVEANPRYIRDVIAVLGLEDSRPVSTPSVERTVTGRAGEREASRVQDSRGTLLHMCQERAHIMYRERSRVPSAKCTIEISSVRERVHRQRLGRTTPNAQEHKRCSHAVGSTTLSAWSHSNQ